MSFDLASAVERVSDLEYLARIPDGWQQGRGAFGGLVLGILLRAMERSEPDSRRVVRSLSGDICGPVVVGESRVRVRVLRRGHNQSNLAAELTQGSEVLATATCVLSPPRTEAAHAGFLGAPPVSDWRGIQPLPVGPPLGPVFTQHYSYRDAGSSLSSVQGWIGEATPLAKLDAPALIGRLDAWWPTLFQIEMAPRPVATISFGAQILADPASLGTGPLRYRAMMGAMNDGFFVEMRELWQGERVVALNQQTFAILK